MANLKLTILAKFFLKMYIEETKWKTFLWKKVQNQCLWCSILNVGISDLYLKLNIIVKSNTMVEIADDYCAEGHVDRRPNSVFSFMLN